MGGDSMLDVCKKCYEYCDKYDFDSEKIYELAVSLGVDCQRVREMALEYSRRVMDESIINSVSKIDRFREYEGIDLEIKDWVNGRKERLEYYLKIGGSTYLEFFNNMMRECYEYAEEVDFSWEMVYEYGINIGISKKEIHYYVERYYCILNNCGHDGFAKMIKQKSMDKVNAIILQRLLLSSDEMQLLYYSLDGGTYQEFAKKLEKYFYEYSRRVNFSKERIYAYLYKMNISYTTFRMYVKRYMQDNPSLDKFYLQEEEHTRVDIDKNMIDLSYRYAKDVDYDYLRLQELARYLKLSYRELVECIIDRFKVELEYNENKANEERYAKRLIKLRNKIEKSYDEWMRGRMLQAYLLKDVRYQELYDMLGATDLRDFYYKLGCFFYKECLRYEWNKEMIDILASNYGYSYQEVYKYIEFYAAIENIPISKINKVLDRKNNKVRVKACECEK